MADHVEERPLQIYDSRDEAEEDLHKYAQLCKSFGLTETCRVRAAPMQKGRYKGTWGVWLVTHRQP